MIRRHLDRLLLAVVVFGLLASAAPLAGAQSTPVSVEQQLADQFAPIVMIKQQPEACDDSGEQFRPVAVDILFGTDDVRLMKRGNGGKQTDTEVKRNIQASDLYGLGDEYYLDLPGEPRDPECVYEKWGKKRMAELGMEPSLYARITNDPSAGKIVLQYWYYWIFNDFNNTHESDWEGVQLTFDAESVQQILDQQLLPSSIAFAQHEGGEQANWDDDKVETDGTHIVSHPSSGSHADYYQSAVWLGWGENGSGFGCDYSDEPDVELPVKIILLPDGPPDPNGDFAWLTYTGLWGERNNPSMFSGPTGPITKPRWDDPVGWGDNIRAASLPVPVQTTIGPSVTQVFCGAAKIGSTFVRLFPIDPKVVVGILVAVALGLLFLAAMAWHTFSQAIRLYFRHGYFFITAGIVAFPLAAVGQWIEDRVQDVATSSIDPHLPNRFHSRSFFQFLLHTGLGGVQEILLACIIGPVVMYATVELSRSERANWRRTWEHGTGLFPRVLGASFYVALLLSLMWFSVVLIPVAVYKSVQWFFAPEAVVVDNAGWRNARHISAARLQGHWIRGLALVVATSVVSGVPGPLIGTIGLVLNRLALNQAQWLSAGVYCVLYPISLIMATLFYLHVSVAPGTATPNAAPADPPEALIPGTAPA
jgi:hypothetical protein